MICCNIMDLPPLETKNGENFSFQDYIKYLPDSIRKEIRLLCKQYYITTIEQCGERYSFNECGEEYELDINYFNEAPVLIRHQKYNIKIEYTNTETRQEFFKVFLSYEN